MECEEMRFVFIAARVMLGFVFLVFGLNGFLHFIAIPPVPGVAAQFMEALFVSHYLSLIFALDALAGALLLANRFVPLALVLLGPIVVNIFFFHALMAPDGMSHAILPVVLWLLAAWEYRRYFSGIFVHKAGDAR
jgi:hypothetical protein